MRTHPILYGSYIHPETDTTRGGMTGQLVLAKGLAAADAPADEWKQAMKKASKKTISAQLSRIGQARQELDRAEMEDLRNDYPDVDISEIAAAVAARATETQRNLSKDLHGNLLPPDVQRRKNFNHGAGLPPPSALISAPPPLALPAPNAAA